MRVRERGVALVTAILIVAIVATLATSLALGQQVWLRQTQNLADLAQSEKIRRGALEFAAAILARDARDPRTSATDDLTEDWARPIPPLPVDGGAVAVAISDAQARFNLNNLLHQPRPGAGQNPGGPAQVNHAAVYRALLVALEIEPARIDTLIDALLDWVDPDSTVSANGAEDLDYLNHDPPYRAANQALRSVDELRLVKGYTAEIVEKLRPYVIALPASGAVAVNVNTAPAPVLAALTGRSINDAEQIVRTRAQTPFKRPEDFAALLGGQPGQVGNYDVKSGYFIVEVTTRIGRTQRRTEALVDRPIGGDQKATVLWYRQPAFQIVLDQDDSDEGRS